jgi:hypothetical protein
MQEILDFIEIKKQEFANSSFFEFFQDPNNEPREKILFLPCITHWVMSFADLNKYIFRQEPAEDEIQKVINYHTYEDSNHWILFLEDLKKINFDNSLSFTEFVKFIWSKDTIKIRQMSYKFAGYTFRAKPMQKLIVIESIEAAGHAFFCVSTKLTQELKPVLGKEYQYLGQHHLERETGHTIGFLDREKLISEIQLTGTERQEAFELVQDIFNIFTEAADEALIYLQEQRDLLLNSAINSAS